MVQRALVLGVANKRSIAWSCVRALLQRNYQVAFTYQSDRFENTAKELIASETQDSDDKVLLATTCNVEKDVPLLFDEKLPELFGDEKGFDVIVHSVAHASAQAMKEGTLLDTTRQDFLQAHDISAYSFLEVARCAPLSQDASLTALSYLGAVRAVPRYNVMGPAKASLEALVRGLALELPEPQQRVNCVSAGPLSTLAARGIDGFSRIRQDVEERSPLRRNVTTEEVANTVCFVACDATGMSGQTVYVDAGYGVVAGPSTAAAAFTE